MGALLTSAAHRAAGRHRDRDALLLPRPQPARHAERPARRFGHRPAQLLLITGDPPKMGPYPDATAVFDIDSIGLTNLVRNLNHGLDPGGNPIGEPTQFAIGVGVNPAAIDPAARAQAVRVEGRGGRRVRDHAARVRRRRSSSTSSRRIERHPHSDRRRHLAAGVASATRSSSPTRCRASSCRTPIIERMRTASEKSQGARGRRGDRHRARDARPRARRRAGRAGVGAVREGGAGARGVRRHARTGRARVYRRARTGENRARVSW